MKQATTLGDRIATARKAHELGTNQLARLIEVSPSQVTRWEADELTPSPRSLVSLAQHLELSATELFELAGIPVPTDAASLPAMLRTSYDLPPEAIADVQRYITRVAEKYHREPSSGDSN